MVVVLPADTSSLGPMQTPRIALLNGQQVLLAQVLEPVPMLNRGTVLEDASMLHTKPLQRFQDRFRRFCGERAVLFERPESRRLDK